jgi:hypothetical protein
VPPLEDAPTAQMLVGETARMLLIKLRLLPGSGVVATVQAEPSQCSIRAWDAPLLKEKPATQTLQGESTAVLNSVFSAVPGFSGCAPVQLSQDAARAPAGPSPVSMPASTSAAASAVTIRRG